MLLFGLVAIALPGCAPAHRRYSRQRVTALLLFSPWFFLLDLICSMTIWAAVGSCVPEPNSMFVSGPWIAWDLWRIWLIRLIVPVPLIGAMFFRSVLRWPWWLSVISGFVLIVPATVLWWIWDDAFLRFEIYQLVMR
jgi:hypothetical protein